MILLYKYRSETPLRALSRLRVEQPELAQETLSYAGRLDPMTEGILPVLVGEEENRNRKDFLDKDKEYQAHFVIGCSTDTNDILGLVTKSNFIKIDPEILMRAVMNLKNITVQVYPWYSSKTVNGIPLFAYAKAGNFDIERPTRAVEVYSVTDIDIYEIDAQEWVQQNIADIQKVYGDFRQDAITNSWNTLSWKFPIGVQVVSCVLKVSSGTYIRTMAENLAQELGVPVLLQKLVRVSVF